MMLRMSTPTRTPLLTPTEVAKELGLPPRTVEQWRYRNLGPRYVKVGRHVRYRPADIDVWIEQQVRD
jgi:excisionase family DNA binding protein